MEPDPYWPKDCPGVPEEYCVKINLCEALTKLSNTQFLTHGE
jgi:hypothetical protein